MVQAETGRDGGEFGPATPALLFHRSLDSDQKDQLIEVIEKLLADKTTVSGGHVSSAPKPGDITVPTDPASSWGCRCPH